MTTFSVDAAFYDSFVFQRLRTYGCSNNVLLADKNMLDRAIEETPESFARAGTGYAIFPVSTSACFHPKIHLRLGSDAGSLIIGSANATAAGWGGNREIVASFDWRVGKSNADGPATHALIRKAYDYLEGWLAAPAMVAMDHKFDIIRRDASWLFDAEASLEPIEFPDGSLADLFVERGDGAQPGMLARLRAQVGASLVRRIVLISPYWDVDLRTLQELRREFGSAEIVVGLPGQSPQFPVAELGAMEAIRFAKIFDGGDAARVIHAKILLLETDEYDHLLFGSANCSEAALGSLSRAASNAECSVYRRLDHGQGLALLGLDLTRSYALDEIAHQSRQASEPVAPSAFPPGTIEASGPNVRWRPSRKINEPAGASLKIGEARHPFTEFAAGTFRLKLPSLPIYPLIARIELADGQLSSPTLVNDDLQLARAAPGLGDRRLRAAFDKIQLGQEDILDLAALATIIFSEGSNLKKPSVTVRSNSGGPGTDSGGKDEEGSDYRSPEEFRAAVESRAPARGETHQLNFDDPDAVNLLRIIMRGLSAELEDVAEEELDSDPNGVKDKGGANGGAPPPPPPPPPPPRRFSRAQVEKRKLDVLKAMAAFSKYVDGLIRREAPPPRKLTAETCFLVRLLVQAARQGMVSDEREGEMEVYALPLVPKGQQREDNFVVRIGQLLRKLWIGSKSQPALLSRLSIIRHVDELPYDCFALVVFTRWAMARSDMSMASHRLDALANHVRSNALAIWRATALWPEIDPEAEIEMVMKLERALDIDPAETTSLISHYRVARAAMTGKSVTAEAASQS